jgi:CRP/FNR family transcriptional regulator, nitrogen oxide reductase regulator
MHANRVDPIVPGTAVGHPPLFSSILPSEYSSIAAAAHIKEFARGEILYVEGDPVPQVLLITSGMVKTAKVGMSGQEVILGLATPGDVLGALGLFSTGRHCTTAQAFRVCRALAWDAPAFRALLARFPVLHQNMVRILVRYMRQLQERFRELSTEKVGLRVARQLARLRDQIGQPAGAGGAVEIGLSREELAQMTGTTLFSVSRILSSWEALGILKLGRETVIVCDLPALRALFEEKDSIPSPACSAL